jgi:hypothetical protein
MITFPAQLESIRSSSMARDQSFETFLAFYTFGIIRLVHLTQKLFYIQGRKLSEANRIALRLKTRSHDLKQNYTEQNDSEQNGLNHSSQQNDSI